MKQHYESYTRIKGWEGEKENKKKNGRLGKQT